MKLNLLKRNRHSQKLNIYDPDIEISDYGDSVYIRTTNSITRIKAGEVKVTDLVAMKSYTIETGKT